MGFRYLQRDEERSLSWRFLRVFLGYLLAGGLFFVLGMIILFYSDLENWGFGALLWPVIFGGIGLLILIWRVNAYRQRLQEMRESLVAILEGPISSHWKHSYGGEVETTDYIIEVLGQTHTIKEALWKTLKAGDTVRIAQLPRSRELVHIERVTRTFDRS